MLNVKTPDQVYDLLRREFAELSGEESVLFIHAAGRILAEDITASEYVPDFSRSSVDGYAVRAEDTFGCSDSIPAILEQTGQVLMGEKAEGEVTPGSCYAVPTGGHIPDGADSVVMVEYTEDYGDGTIGILKSAAPGMNVVFRGDDVKPGRLVLPKGRILGAKDIGTLAAMGVTQVRVKKKIKVGIIATGDELVEPREVPQLGQVRNIHSYLLSEYVREAGGEAVLYGIIRDDIHKLNDAVVKASRECDMVIVTGGTSVGVKDATFRVIRDNGTILFHGIAMKPGKPTILGAIDNKPVWGLPGHPVAAAFVMRLFVVSLMDHLSGCTRNQYPTTAILEESVGANHGRQQYMGATLREEKGKLYAKPIRSKSGLITSLAASCGYFVIDRDCEGLPVGSAVSVFPFDVY